MRNRSLWSLLEIELDYTVLNQCGYFSYDQNTDGCTALLCGVDTMDIAGAMSDPHDTFFIVALNNPMKELQYVPKNFDAWIDITKIDSLPTLLAAYDTLIKRKEQQRFIRNALQSFMVNSTVHKSNLESVKDVIRSSTNEIETIFESRVDDLKSVKISIEASLDKTSSLRDRLSDEDKETLNQIIELNETSQNQVANIIKAMRGFIIVLQCEDRISQMLDGIGNIIDHDIHDVQSNGLYVPLDKEAPIKASLADFYTIQEQRDFAMGIDSSPSSCSQSEDDGFILF